MSDLVDHLQEDMGSNYSNNIGYTRVLPRDLFNEAKLLKCMGRLSLLVHDNMTPLRLKGNWNVPVKIKILNDGKPFDIVLLDEGALTIANIVVLVKGHIILFKTTYNSKSNYPLLAQHLDIDYLVFDSIGNWDEEFFELCENIL